MDGKSSDMYKMLEKWCDLTILTVSDQPDFAKVIKTYEKIGMKRLGDGLMKHSAKDFLFKAGCCYFANEDLIGAKHAYENFCLEDPTFEQDYKGKFLKSILIACESLDSEIFQKAVISYQSWKPFDKVITKLIAKTKTHYCPEKLTAISTSNKVVNLIDGDD